MGRPGRIGGLPTAAEPGRTQRRCSRFSRCYSFIWFAGRAVGRESRRRHEGDGQWQAAREAIRCTSQCLTTLSSSPPCIPLVLRREDKLDRLDRLPVRRRGPTSGNHESRGCFLSAGSGMLQRFNSGRWCRPTGEPAVGALTRSGRAYGRSDKLSHPEGQVKAVLHRSAPNSPSRAGWTMPIGMPAPRLLRLSITALPLPGGRSDTGHGPHLSRASSKQARDCPTKTRTPPGRADGRPSDMK